MGGTLKIELVDIETDNVIRCWDSTGISEDTIDNAVVIYTNVSEYVVVPKPGQMIVLHRERS